MAHHPEIIKVVKAKVANLQKGKRKSKEFGLQLEAEVVSKYKSLRAADPTIEVPIDLGVCAPHFRGKLNVLVTHLVKLYRPGFDHFDPKVIAAHQLKDREDYKIWIPKRKKPVN